MGNLLLLLQAGDLLMTAIANAGVDFAHFNAMRDTARAENRQLTVAELRSLVPAAQAAIDSINQGAN